MNKRGVWKSTIGLIMALILSLSSVSGLATATVSAATTSEPVATLDPSRPRYDPDKPENLQNLFLYAETAVLIDQHSGEVLYDMYSNKTMHPASTTKTLTLLVALENGNLDDVITVGPEINQIPGDSSRVPLIEGEQLTLRDLLYGLIICSGNDAAVVIAKSVGGSVDEFVKMMNEKALELGCTGSNFTTPHGYQDKNQYTTARDLARIARAGMEIPEFRQIVGAAEYTIPSNNKRTSNYTILTKNQFVGRRPEMTEQYEYGTGIKTGYFADAQHTFIGSATKDGKDLIAVVLKTTQQGKWIDAKRLMEYGFAVTQPYSVKDLYDQDPIQVPFIDQTTEKEKLLTLQLVENQTGTFVDTPENIATMKTDFSEYYTYQGPTQIVESITEGQEIGKLVFKPINGETSTFTLVAQDIEANGIDVIVKEGSQNSVNWPVLILIGLGVILVIIVIIRIRR